jgi:hypothetical protein
MLCGYKFVKIFRNIKQYCEKIFANLWRILANKLSDRRFLTGYKHLLKQKGQAPLSRGLPLLAVSL